MMETRNRTRWTAARQALACVAAFVVLGCQGKPPRPTEQVFADRESLPSLYLTKKSHTRVIAPRGKGMFVDPATKEECWPALACINPDCPGKTDKEPYLFITWDDRGDGCPACAKKRGRTLTLKERHEISKYIVPYELPESLERAKQLDDEYKRSTEYERKIRK